MADQRAASLGCGGFAISRAGHEVFRVVAPRFAATLLQSKNSRQAARIVFADLLVRPLSGGGYWARGNYFVLPGGRKELELQLPPGSQLVQVLVNDAPAEIRKQPQETWKIALGH